MAESQLVLKCPHCNCDFEAKPPDSWHIEYSFEEPALVNVYGLKKQEVVCENPECDKTITIYWYAPIDYLSIV